MDRVDFSITPMKFVLGKKIFYLTKKICLTFYSSPSFLIKLESDFNLRFSLDCCSHQGVQIVRPNCSTIPYCSRYLDDFTRYLNFFNLPFTTLINEVCWIFPPRAQMTQFVQYYLSFSNRPTAMFVVLQHAERPSILELLLKRAIQHRIYTGAHMLRRPVSNRNAFSRYMFNGRLHAILLPRVQE